MLFLLVIMWATNRYVYLEEFRKYEVDYNVLVTIKSSPSSISQPTSSAARETLVQTQGDGASVGIRFWIRQGTDRAA